MAKPPGVADLTLLRIEYAPSCRGAVPDGSGYPFAILQPFPAPILVGGGNGNPHKPPKPDNGKDKPVEGETPYVPPPTVPGGQGSTASDEGPGTGGTDPPPTPPDVVVPMGLVTTTVLSAAPTPVVENMPLALRATVAGPLGSWGSATFNVAADRLLRTTDPPSLAGPWTAMLDVRFTSMTGLYQTIFGLGPATDSYIFIAADPAMALYGEGGNSAISMSGPGFTFALNTWYSVAIVRGASANKLDVYVNDMATPALSGTGGQGVTYTRFEFGGFGTGNLHHLDGAVRRIVWFNRVLSSAERTLQAAAAEALDRTAALQGEYLFESYSGADTSGLGRDATVVGTPTIRPSPQGTVQFVIDDVSVGSAPTEFGIADLVLPSGLTPDGTYPAEATYLTSVADYANSEATPLDIEVVLPSGGGGGTSGSRSQTGWLAVDKNRLRRRNFGI